MQLRAWVPFPGNPPCSLPTLFISIKSIPCTLGVTCAGVGLCTVVDEEGVRCALGPVGAHCKYGPALVSAHNAWRCLGAPCISARHADMCSGAGRAEWVVRVG